MSAQGIRGQGLVCHHDAVLAPPLDLGVGPQLQVTSPVQRLDTLINQGPPRSKPHHTIYDALFPQRLVHESREDRLAGPGSGRHRSGALGDYPTDDGIEGLELPFARLDASVPNVAWAIGEIAA